MAAGLWLLIHARVRFLLGWRFPALDADTALPDPPGGWPFLSVIVPARNEERDAPECLRSLRAQDYPAYEIIFVDDESTDRTAAVAGEILADDPRARVVRGQPRPSARWVGKNWALVQGGEQARGEWLVFVDADIYHHPLTLRRAVALACEREVDALSIMPVIDCHTIWEKIVMPLFALLAALVEPMDRTNHPRRKACRLAGAFILIRRAAYEQIGGHRAVYDQMLEDMALARNLKARQIPLCLTYTHDLTRTRMYDTLRELWMGLMRATFPMLRYSLWLLPAIYLAAFIGTLMPWLAVIGGLALWALHGHAAALLAAAGGVVICGGANLALTRIFRLLRVSRVYAWFLPLAAAIFCLAATHAAFRCWTGRGLGWKQRTYEGK